MIESNGSFRASCTLLEGVKEKRCSEQGGERVQNFECHGENAASSSDAIRLRRARGRRPSVTVRVRPSVHPCYDKDEKQQLGSFSLNLAIFKGR